eukprot:gene11483-4647_t
MQKYDTPLTGAEFRNSFKGRLKAWDQISAKHTICSESAAKTSKENKIAVYNKIQKAVKEDFHSIILPLLENDIENFIQSKNEKKKYRALFQMIIKKPKRLFERTKSARVRTNRKIRKSIKCYVE